MSPESHIFHQASCERGTPSPTALDEGGPFPPVCADIPSLKEGKGSEGENRDEVALREILDDLVLDVPDVSVSPEHDGTESDGLRDGEEEIECQCSTKSVVEATSREQSVGSRVGKVVTRSREGEPAHEEGKGTARLPFHHKREETPTASFSSAQSSE